MNRRESERGVYSTPSGSDGIDLLNAGNEWLSLRSRRYRSGYCSDKLVLRRKPKYARVAQQLCERSDPIMKGSNT